MAEARDFKFGTQLWFAKAHHKTTPSRKVGVAFGWGSSYIFGVPLSILCNGRAVLLALAELLVQDTHTMHLQIPFSHCHMDARKLLRLGG